MADEAQIFQWTTLGVALVFVLLRLYLRFPPKGCRRQLLNLDRLSDFLVVFAWLCYLDQACLDIVLSKTSFFGDLWAPGVPIDVRVRANKIFYAECMTYLFCMYSVKFSLLIQYHQSLPSGYEYWKWFRRGLIALDAVVACGLAVAFLPGLIICWPISRNWSPDPELFCPYYHVRWWRAVSYGFHVTTDILVYLLPMFFINSLQNSRAVKLGLALAFLVGFVSITCAVATTVSLFKDVPYKKRFFVTHLEQTTAIIAGCLPALRAIVEAWHKRDSERVLPVTEQDVPKNSPKPEEEKASPTVPVVVVLAEARKHADWMRGVVVQEHLARTELTSQAEDRALKEAGVLSSSTRSNVSSTSTEHITVTPNKKQRWGLL